jgi:hypothetical protein
LFSVTLEYSSMWTKEMICNLSRKVSVWILYDTFMGHCSCILRCVHVWASVLYDLKMHWTLTLISFTVRTVTIIATIADAASIRIKTEYPPKKKKKIKKKKNIHTHNKHAHTHVKMLSSLFQPCKSTTDPIMDACSDNTNQTHFQTKNK